jgi:hypothetical protein
VLERQTYYENGDNNTPVTNCVPSNYLGLYVILMRSISHATSSLAINSTREVTVDDTGSICNKASMKCQQGSSRVALLYLAAYKAIKPAMKGTVIKATPAMAIGSFSSSVILSVLLRERGKPIHVRLVDKSEWHHSETSSFEATPQVGDSRFKVVLRFGVAG